MEMPRDTRRNLACLSLIGLALMIIMFIAFLVLIPPCTNFAFPADKTFTLIINSQQVLVNLPDALPEMDTAIFNFEECFDLKVCRQQFCLNARALGHDHIDFVFNGEEVFALVWIRTIEAEYVAWKYVDGIPILSSIDEIKAIILGDKKFKET